MNRGNRTESLSMRGRVFRGFRGSQRLSEAFSSETLSEADSPLRGCDCELESRPKIVAILLA